ncbi:replication endonuclease [Photobacterium sp. CCB-ST2H9]|uniref:replication endonuclease n=1 Tax=Photobacterium sp. CCB-ST2H9 TaxID=2912855 RepID=UPI0020C652E0|nr:replication endonuclease [Photobacterium sp. CCB-ST2H9]UTM57036.1 replication endonuclease [Photobacterium sp. CCB-ST2H9]
MQHGTVFTRHFLKRLPQVVRQDIRTKIASRQQRGGATRDNLDRFADEAVKFGLKVAPFIEDKFSFVDFRNRVKSERLTHHILMKDEAVRQLARLVADENMQAMQDIDPQVFDSFLSAMKHIYAVLAENLLAISVNPPVMPGDKMEEERAEQELTASVLKMQSEEWIERRLMHLRSQYIEYAQIALERVGDKGHQSKYISYPSFQNWKNKQREAERFIQSTVVYNEATGEHFDLEEVIKRTTANPENRRIEMMVRSRGFEELALDLGYTALFLTWTLPSKYHRNSKKWNGASVKEGHGNLMQQWAQARALIAKEDIHYFGFRVAEPHKDGTSHGHYFLFCHPKDKDTLIHIISGVATAEDRDELGQDISPRFDVKEADPAKGGATAYIAKYVSKNINGQHMPETEAEESAFRVRAWASVHRIRQFQQFGGEPVSLWRHLRRATEEQTRIDPKLEALRQAADSSKWSLFCQLATDARLAYEEKQNQYGETVKKAIGFHWFSEGVSTFIATCSETYRLVKKSELGALLESRSGSPWSTENNCNSQLGEHLQRVTGWSLAGVQCLINPLLAGAKVPIDKDCQLKLANNRIVMTRGEL